ncbi:RND transporter [Amycolatopsis sp.]|uniref:RND transporter n=1 Tax=Amycolatopsis sp. TaxID=37632 RepID=UPI002DF85BA0|nr:RND transporter [Amycolatopsis sp.]
MRNFVRSVTVPLRRPARFLKRLVTRPRSVRRPSGRQVVAAVLALGCLGAIGGGLLRLQLDTTVSSLLPQGDPVMQAIDDKARGFGGDPIVVVLETDQPRRLLIDNGQLPRLVGLEGQLSRLPDAAVVYGPGTVLNQIAGGAKDVLAAIGGRRQVVAQLAEQQARDQHKTAAEATAAGEKALRDFDVRYGQFIARGLPAGLPTLYNPAFVQTAIFDGPGAPKPQWRFVVPSQNSVAILVRPREGLDENGARALTDGVRSAVSAAGLVTSRVTISGVPVVATALADEIWSELPLLVGLALVGCSLVLLTIPRYGSRRARLWPLAVMASAAAITLAVFGWLGVPISLGVLALLPILLGVGSDFPLYLAQGAHRHRVVVSGLASAGAAACLCLCPLPIVRQLGLALAGGILLVIALGLVLGPWAPGPHTGPADPLSPAWTRPRRSVAALLLLVTAVVAGAGWTLLPRIGIDADPQRLAAGLSAIDDATHVQEVLGSSSELNVVVSGQNLLSPQALTWMQQTSSAMVTGFGDRVQPVISPADLLRFLGADPTPAQVSAAMDLVPRYLTSSVIRSDRTEALMVFGMRVDDVVAQRSVLDEIRSALPKPPAGLKADVVGVPVVTARAYDVVADSRLLATLSGIVAAGAVLLIGLRRRSDAWRAVLAGALATGWGLALLWAAGGTLTPLTVTLGALTTAVGCEFFVLLAEARRTRSRALLWGVATACANSTVGYLVLTASGLTVLRDFGLLLAVSVVLSYLAALLIVWLLPPRVRETVPGVSTPTKNEEVRV